MAAAGLVVAWVAGRLGVRGSYAGRYAISVGGMLFHILFDILTSYGTQIFAPFTDYRAAVDVLFIIDPYMTGILLLGLILGWRANARWYRIGFARFLVITSVNGPRIVIEDLTYKVRDAGLGWLGKAALEWMQRRNPDFVDRRIFWIEADTESREVMFRR